MQPLLARAIPLAAAVVLGCRAPTQVTVEVSTDVPCAELRGVTLTVGEPGALEALSPTTATDACAQGDPRSRVGSIVVVPSDEIDDAFGLRIVGGVDGEADACAAPDYAGCIVARREMRFVPHTELYLPVVLRGSCKDVPCDATTTCVLGECVPAVVIDPGACVDPEACGEGSLGGGAGGAGGAGGGAGGSGGSGGEGGGALLPQAECGRPSVLTDDFNAGVKASSWRAVVSPGGASSESGGRLSLTPPPGAQGEAAYRSFHAVNFDEDLIRVEATGLDTNPAAYAAMSAELGPGRRIAIEQRGTLLWSRLVDVVSDNSDVTNYDPVQHRFWQIREASGTLTWETSPDGVTWTTRKTAPTPGFAGTVHVALAAGADQPIAAPLGAHFEDFNRVRTPAVWCPASSFTDDFEDGQEGIAWSASQSTGDCTRSEGGGNAHFNMPGNGASMCKYQTSTAFDLTDSWIAV
ncbi:MAG: hypothetical protein IT372_34535, partial [Polyangiaceae bacterium]|nr:hypothetical protein [Polyangiaceae bacterium]